MTESEKAKAAEEAAHFVNLSKQWALKRESARGRHVKVDGGSISLYEKKSPPALDVILTTEKDARKEVIMAARAALQVGQCTGDGIFIGRFKNKDGVEKDWFADTADALDENGNKLALRFDKAAEYAQNSRDLDHDDWMVPPGEADPSGEPDILSALFNNRSVGAFKDSFDENDYKDADSSGLYAASWYGSSSLRTLNTASYVQAQQFTDGDHDIPRTSDGLSIRLVRSLTV